MKLLPVRGNPDAAGILYQLLEERPRGTWISHEKLPARDEHERFVEAHPFVHWYLIDNHGVYVGAIEVTDRNEIGVAILKQYQRKGFAYQALSLFLANHQPLPAIPAIRNGRWLANIAVRNGASKDFFSRMGFLPLQETWIL